MDKQPVGQLPNLTQSNNDDEIMVITNSEYNQLKKEKISDFITDLTSTDENNAIVKGTDGKLFTKDFGNASNITEGTLPVSVLPDIPKDKLPEIETDDLPDSGITAGTYTYPTDIVVNSKGQVTSITEGQAGANNANQDLSNLGPLGLDKLNQSKALETGSVSSDADVYADIQKYAHSTFDLSKFEVVGSPNITDDGIASGFSVSDCIYTNVFLNFSDFNAWELTFKVYVTDSTDMQALFWLRPEGNANLNTNQSYINQNKTITWNLHETPIYGTASRLFSYTTNFTLTENSTYFLKYKFTGTQYLIGYSTDNENYIWETAQTSTTRCEVSGYVQMGLKYNSFPFLSSFDLKQFSITVDGVPVFNGNKTGTDTIDEIEIPYTLSKTGSKIVDVAYRDRVQDMYEQYGYAPYYTIDEENENFTLPMGEIYGMIENSRHNNYITNCILKAPNGVATFSGSNITLKQGLKMLYPNGRNADGTLKNGELTLDSDSIIDLSPHSGQTFDFELMFGCNINDSYLSQNYQESDVVPTNISGGNPIYLNTTENQMYFYVSSSSSWDKKTFIKLGKGKLENGVVTSFTPDQPVELIKRTDPQIQAPYITETYSNGTSWYRVWSDGWIEQGGLSNSNTSQWDISLLKSFSNTNYSVQLAILNAIPGTSTDNIKVNGRWTNHIKVWAIGANERPLLWRAEGY